MTNSSVIEPESLHLSFSKSLFFNLLSYAGVVFVTLIFYVYGKNLYLEERRKRGTGWMIFKRFFEGDEKERVAREIRNC